MLIYSVVEVKNFLTDDRANVQVHNFFIQEDAIEKLKEINSKDNYIGEYYEGMVL